MSSQINVVGAGLVGSLLGLRLRQKGFDVRLYERRSDPRKVKRAEGRSINLALSHRGIGPLKAAGVYDQVAPYLIPMKGRMMHSKSADLTVQPYGKEGQHINSVPRSQLNKVLLEAAEQQNVEVFFEHQSTEVDLDMANVHFSNGNSASGDVLIGTDGAFSSVRKSMQLTDRFNFSQQYIEHGYKELHIAAINESFALDPNYLHIWPRGNFMLIALPNFDKTFTCTLFFPYEGDVSFASLRDEAQISDFFSKYFPDIPPLIPDLIHQFQNNPTASLITTKCDPWHRGKTIILGDAAHAIVPFYGQGMNSGFEDVRIFGEVGESVNWNWNELLPTYSKKRKRDADAISELALMNFVEMRDHVADPKFLRQKKLEAAIHDRFPKDWLPLYSMVTFSDMPYSEALRLGKIQGKIMQEVLEEGKDLIPEAMDFREIVERYKARK
ncbi:MAG: NAD(P)/FAD-dependent oxidoreductase [Bacteroidota bacterium]